MDLDTVLASDKSSEILNSLNIMHYINISYIYFINTCTIASIFASYDSHVTLAAVGE